MASRSRPRPYELKVVDLVLKPSVFFWESAPTPRWGGSVLATNKKKQDKELPLWAAVLTKAVAQRALFFLSFKSTEPSTKLVPSRKKVFQLVQAFAGIEPRFRAPLVRKALRCALIGPLGDRGRGEFRFLVKLGPLFIGIFIILSLPECKKAKLKNKFAPGPLKTVARSERGRSGKKINASMAVRADCGVIFPIRLSFALRRGTCHRLVQGNGAQTRRRKPTERRWASRTCAGSNKRK